MSMNEKDFIKRFEDLRSWIRNSVSAFKDDSAEDKLARLGKAESDKFFFAKTYFPHYIEDEFAPIHKEMFDLADTVNQPVVVAGARELAKSTVISFFDELHKTLFKKNKFTVFVCDTQETAAAEFILPIRAELEENQRIIADFGEMKTSYWSMEDLITKSGKRFLALGPKMGAKGKRHRQSRPDRIICEDMENRNSPQRKSVIKRRLKFILTDVMKSVSSKKWQFIFIGNYFSKKTILHYLLTADEFSHWTRRIFPALIEVPSSSHELVHRMKKPKSKSPATATATAPATSSPATATATATKIISAWESRLPLKMLLEEQRQDPYTFRTERLQKPEDEEAVFKDEWIRYFELKDIPDSLPVVTYHDPSALKGEEHCFKATITLAVDKSAATYYVLNAWIRKQSKWNAAYKHFELSKKFHSAVDAIESNGFQASLKEDYELIEEKLGRRLNLKLINNRLPKDVRISRLSSLIERGYIKFVRNDSDQNELVEQLLDFPDGEFVDGPDALAGAVETADQFIFRKTNKIKAKLL